ncbi:thioredoxin-like protein [Cerioporus squamosus]|nr:thioredoxin-like protein [Cerioporus squamosus]
MSHVERITLYASVDSPFPHRVRLALEEAQVPYDIIWVDLLDKPEWYGKNVYPEAKVPYLVYGGPKLNPGDAPPPDTVQLPESLVINEFLADILPSAKLLPADPALRAKARLFTQAVDTKVLPAFVTFFFKGAPKETLLDALEDMQRKLPAEGYAVGDWSIADAAFTPFLMRINALLKLDRHPPMMQEGAAKAVLEALGSPRFARLHKYWDDNVARPSMAKAWDEAAILENFKVRLENMAKTGAWHPSQH